MMNIDKLMQRFTRDSYQIRMGNLASNLLRLSNAVQQGNKPEFEKKLLWEICWMAEWVGDSPPVEIADMQREMCRWRNIWPLDAARPVLAYRSKKLAEQVLDKSGLVESRA